VLGSVVVPYALGPYGRGSDRYAAGRQVSGKRVLNVRCVGRNRESAQRCKSRQTDNHESSVMHAAVRAETRAVRAAAEAVNGSG